MTHAPRPPEELLEDAVNRKVFAGYQLVAHSRKHSLKLSGGATSYFKQSQKVTDQTFFDLGSLTKVLATTFLWALDYQDHPPVLNETLQSAFPELKHHSLGKLLATDLLSHRSGLVAWKPLFCDLASQPASSQDFLQWLQAHEKEIVEGPAGQKCVYSDFNFILLGLWLERRHGKSLRTLWEKQLGEPFGIEEVFYPQKPDANEVLHYAATEYCTWRGRLLQGEVFDENTAALGGVCGHAGLFGTARGVAQINQIWLQAWESKQPRLARKTLEAFTWGYTPSCPGSFRLGWDTKSKSASTAGTLMGPHTIGHLGFPGCSLWIDLEHSMQIVLLTNRIHPSRVDHRIREFRPLIHDAVVSYLRNLS